MTLYTFFATATALNHDEFPDGERHPVVLFAVADSEPEAVELMSERLSGIGWDEIVIEQSSPLSGSLVNVDDPDFRYAISRALDDGVSIVTYDGIVEDAH